MPQIQNKDDISVFTEDELSDFVDQINRGRDKATQNTNTRFARVIVSCTQGVINKATTSAVVDTITAKYDSFSSRRKGLGFYKRFLSHLNNTKEGVNFTPFIGQIGLFKVKKPKRINRDIIFSEDIQNLISHIKNGNMASADTAIALVYHMAYCGMREATCDRLTVKHIKEAFSLSPSPCIFIGHDMDKTSTEHYVPIHPFLIPIFQELIKDKNDNDIIFDTVKLATYLKNHRIYQKLNPTKPLLVKHLRKYFIQKSTEIGLNNDFRDYIVSNDMQTTQWQHYKNFTYQQVYEAYIQAWGQIQFVDKENLNQ